MPAPALLFVGGGPVAKAAVSNAARVSSLTLATLLVRESWKRVPEWIQQDMGIRSMLKNRENDGDEDELNSLSNILSRLNQLLHIGRKKLKLSPVKWHISLLLTIQLMAQIQTQFPQIRNSLYDSSSLLTDSNSNDSSDENDCTSLNKLRKMLDFATWAYEVDTNLLSEWLLPHEFVILQHFTPTKEQLRPGYVAHFVAINSKRKEILVGVRGTVSFEDLVTDCCGNSVPYIPSSTFLDGNPDEVDDHVKSQGLSNDSNHSNLDDDETNKTDNQSIDNIKDNDESYENDSPIKQGIEICVIGNNEIGKRSNNSFVICNTHNADDETVMYCHQGVFVAAKHLVKSINSLVQHFVNECGYQLILTGHSLGAGAASLAALILSSQQIIHKENMHVYAFASPPVVDYQTSMNCQSFITTVVNNSDIIPRSSMANLIIFTSFLQKVYEKYAPQKDDSTTQADFKKSIWKKNLFQKLWQGTNGDLIMNLEEIQNNLWDTHSNLPLQDPNHLHVPGRVIILHESWMEETSLSSETSDLETKENDTGTLLIERFVTDASHKVLRILELDLTHAITDHLTSSYMRNLDAVIERESNRI